MWIFVSHSTDANDNARRHRVRDLETALKALGHDVLIDFLRVKPGDAWRPEIDLWLAQCHAAILLLTPRALKSEWVLKEAAILAHRAALDPGFRLFPVLLDGVTREQVVAKGTGFAPLYLEATQQVVAADPAGIAAEVHGILGATATPPTRLDLIAKAIALQIQPVDTGELERICQVVTGQPIQWAMNEGRAKRCALELANAIVKGSAAPYPNIAALIQDLLISGLDTLRAKRILNLIAPLWVELQAAALMASLATRNRDAAAKAAPAGAPETWALAMNGTYVSLFTAEMYMRRVYLPDTATIRTIEGGESEDRLEDLTSRIRKEVRARDVPGATEVQVNDYLSKLTRPYFVVLPAPLPDAPLLAQLQKRFGKVTFICQVDESDDPALATPERLALLAPRVDLNRESDAFHDFKDATGRIEAA